MTDEPEKTDAEIERGVMKALFGPRQTVVETKRRRAADRQPGESLRKYLERKKREHEERNAK